MGLKDRSSAVRVEWRDISDESMSANPHEHAVNEQRFGKDKKNPSGNRCKGLSDRQSSRNEDTGNTKAGTEDNSQECNSNLSRRGTHACNSKSHPISLLLKPMLSDLSPVNVETNFGI
jgi:hypothetical protein